LAQHLVPGGPDEVGDRGVVVVRAEAGECSVEQVRVEDHVAPLGQLADEGRLASARGTPEQGDGSVVRFKGHERRSCGRLGG